VAMRPSGRAQRDFLEVSTTCYNPEEPE